MTGDRLAEIRARAEAASGSAWKWATSDAGCAVYRDGPYRGSVDYIGDGLRHTDAEFIAASREDVPWLLAEVDRLRDELGHARMDRAVQADEAQRARDHLTGLDRIAKVTPCTCSAQRTRAEKAEAERDRAREECGYEKRMRAFISEERDRFIDAKKRAEAERDRLAATVERVRELHQPRHIIGDHYKCSACDVAHPCPTITAIEGTNS